MTERLNVDPQALWQSQADGDDAISLDDIRRRARRLERAISIRNLLEYVAALVVVAAVGARMRGESSDLVSASAAMLMAAAVFVAYQLHRRGAATTLPAELGVKQSIDFHRAQLGRQRDLLRTVWRWYLLPFMPGLLGIQIGLVLSGQRSVAHAVAQIAVICAGFAVILQLNRRAARRLQHWIDRLPDHS